MKEMTPPWWEQILRGERQGFWADSFRSLARLSSLGYAAGMRGREMAYGQGWLKTHRLARPTICVGNITAGGTGKTPLVMKLARDLQARGLKPAILLRGYKRVRHTPAPVLVQDAAGIHATAEDAGDEAMELALRLPGVLIGVGANRYAVGKFLLKHGDIDCFLMDDGFQHHALARDINIVTLDVTDPWGGGQLLPAGLLRERPDALRRADAIVLTRTALVGPDRLNMLRIQVSQKLAKGSYLLESVHEPEALRSLATQELLPLKMIDGKAILVASGIGNPRAFVATLHHLGAQVEHQYFAADHSHDAVAAWRWIERHWQPGMPVLMTEKDAMRWGRQRRSSKAFAQTYALRMNFIVNRGVEQWEKLMDVVQTLCHDR